jgi:hypothetical protein
MEPLPQPRRLWIDISMDFIIGLPESPRRLREKPYNAIFVVIDP